MSKLHLSPELAIGYSELSHLIDSIDEKHKNFILAEMEDFGVVQKTSAFTSFEVIQGSGAAITVRAGTAIDQYGNILIQTDNRNNLFTLTDNPGSKTVVLSYDETYLEDGRCDIQPDGTVTLTAFSIAAEVITGGFNKLRGKKQFPSIISFPNSTVNTGEYLVQSVISGKELILNVGEGVLQEDTLQEWAIVGTFTPGVIIPEEDKFPFRYGYAKIELEDVTYPLSVDIDWSIEQPGKIFLASVTYNEGILTIIDWRNINKYKKSEFI